ncbi:cadherin-related family member 5-like isoform X2 [Cynoglossus semilaevis]|uniref:cadherin-related family member 5-like isoform X2 n=1 Tax=Cynoglossus semilaevis TaxID=244447 RepID=UPI0007DC8A3E|nr:cadherin-related family member 5-like isoform X2 [Cynoglossus semilaevis]
MDKSNLILSSFVLIVVLLQDSYGQICTAPFSVNFAENNKIDDVVTEINANEGVTLRSDTEEFRIQGNRLLAAVVFDYETNRSHQAKVTCTKTATGETLSFTILVIVNNLNDNPPVFERTTYNLNVDEMIPVGNSVGRFAATDLDQPSQLFYNLKSESDAFKLRSLTEPDLLMNTLLDYDKVRNISLVLYAQDTPPTDSGGVSFTATATIAITVVDVDNRPPWFQPCNKHQLGVALVCQGDGYIGRVTLNEKVPGVFPLKPGPLHAIDGDSGINDEIMYSFLKGTDELFEIDAVTGNISMLKPAGSLQTINLEVVAAQKNNMNQFAITTVTVSVHLVSLHPPIFDQELYRGVVSAVGSTAVTEQGPLRFSVRDEDYPEGVNPYIKYSISGSSDFIVIDGYLFLNKSLPPGEVLISVVATDTITDEFDSAEVIVEVKSAQPSGIYGPGSMVALGVTLAILLLVCLVIIGLLVMRTRKSKDDWKMIYKVNEFRSALGQSSDGKKEGIQYTNKVFQSNEDNQSMDRTYTNLETEKADRKIGKEVLLREAAVKPPPATPPVDPDYVNQTDIDKADNEKEVKSILTRDRRMDEGYKAVWFKEDIDPDAKDEVVIIPDSTKDDNAIETTDIDPDDTDMDSGVGVKMEDSPDNPDDDEQLTSEL